MSRQHNVFLSIMVLVGSVVLGFAAGLKTPTGNYSASSTVSSDVVVTFQPSRSKKPPKMISEDGTEVGDMPEETLLETIVSAEDLEAVFIGGQVNVGKLGKFASKVVRNGKRYARIRIPLAVELANGKVVAPGRIVYFALEEAAELGLVQASSVRVIAHDNEKLQKLADLINRGIEENRVLKPRDAVTEGASAPVPPPANGLPTSGPPTGGLPASGPQANGPPTSAPPTGGLPAAPSGALSAETPFLEDLPVPLSPEPVDASPAGRPHSGVDSTEQGSERFLSSPTCGCGERACVQTSYFGPRRAVRTRNGRMSSSNHSGLDIGGRTGTPIIAAAKGCVERTLRNPRNGFGLTVYLRHEGGFTTQYSHMQSIAAGLREGQCFQKGETIGRLGATGNCTGPHLHFGVYKNGYAVNPLNHLAVRTNAEFSAACRGPEGALPTLREVEARVTPRATSRRLQTPHASRHEQPSRSNRGRQ